MLTVNDLKPGQRYVVADPGNADPLFRGAVVLGITRQYGGRAVTISVPDGGSDWLGAMWFDAATAPDDEDPDLGARFLPEDEAFAPAAQPVWLLSETSPEFGGGTPRAFSDVTKAHAAAREVIEEYRNHSLVEDQIDQILVELDEAFAATPDNFGAGDGGALFYISVDKVEIE